MSPKLGQPDLKPPSPMPHYHIQTAALAGGLEIEWKSDLWGCQPVVKPKSNHGKQTADHGNSPSHQAQTLDETLLLRHMDGVTMPKGGNKDQGIQVTSSRTVHLHSESAYPQIEPAISRELVNQKNYGFLMPTREFGQNISSNVVTRGFISNILHGEFQLASSRQVPAIDFPDFKKLPSEVKIMIWNNALPTFIEAVVNEDTKQFCAPGPREAILGFCYNFMDMFHMKPIRFSCEDGKQSNLQVIYIRPEVDTIYIGCQALLHLDVQAFCAHPDNQVIENLALSAVSCINLRWCGVEYGRHFGTRSLVGDLVRGLKNLQKLYVVEGDRLHRESEIDHWSKGRPLRYEVTLSDVPVTTAISRYGQRGRNFFWPPTKPWVHSLALRVIQMYKEEVEREKSGKYENIFTGSWSQPEMIPKILSRNLFIWHRKPSCPNAPNKTKFLPRPLPATQFFRNPIKLSSCHNFESARLSRASDASIEPQNKNTNFENRTSFLE